MVKGIARLDREVDGAREPRAVAVRLARQSLIN
jgi:hypothetical protein